MTIIRIMRRTQMPMDMKLKMFNVIFKPIQSIMETSLVMTEGRHTIHLVPLGMLYILQKSRRFNLVFLRLSSQVHNKSCNTVHLAGNELQGRGSHCRYRSWKNFFGDFAILLCFPSSPNNISPRSDIMLVHFTLDGPSLICPLMHQTPRRSQMI